MNIKINGEDVAVADSVSVSGLLVEREVKMPDMVTVELNGDILQRDVFDSTVVAEGDKVEFLYFMGGGSKKV
jgi:sulfur carrier protein